MSLDSSSSGLPRQQPDGWPCPQCRVWNEMNVGICPRCRYPLVVGACEEVVDAEAVTGDDGDASTRKDQISFSVWSCNRCTFLNSRDTDICVVCGLGHRPTEEQRARELSRLEEEEEELESIFERELSFEGEELDRLDETLLDRIATIDVGFHDSLSSPLSPCTRYLQEDGTTSTHEEDSSSSHVRLEGRLFTLFAPHAEEVHLVGDFNAWGDVHASNSVIMKKEIFRYGNQETDISIFTLHHPRACPGQEYKFRVRSRGSKGFAFALDPCCSWIRESAPHRRNCVIYDHAEFRWTDHDFVLPPRNEMVLYELHVGSFTSGGCGTDKESIGTLQGAILKLPHLRELGVNIIELMPITIDSHHDCECWGYDPLSLFAVHPPYGTPDDLKAFVNAAHELGIGVILDWIPNHFYKHSFLPAAFFYRDRRGTTGFGPRPDYRSPYVRWYLRESAMSWLRDFHFDGLRVDSTETMRRFLDKDGVKRDLFEAYTLLQDIVDDVHARFPEKLCIAEDLQNWHMLNGAGVGFDAQWDATFFSVLFHAATQLGDHHRGIDRIAEEIHKKFSGEAFSRILYTENHDTVPEDREKRIPSAIAGSCDDEDCDRGLNLYALKRSTLIATVMICSPGIPMLLQGQEFAETRAPSWPLGPRMRWERRDDENLSGIFRFYQMLCSLRRNLFGFTAGLLGPDVRVYHLNRNDQVIALHRWSRGGPGDDLVALFNFSNRKFHKYKIGMPRTGVWYVRLNTDSKLFSPIFEDYGLPITSHVTAETDEQMPDGLFHSAYVPVGRYSAIILSQDPLAWDFL